MEPFCHGNCVVAKWFHVSMFSHVRVVRPPRLEMMPDASYHGRGSLEERMSRGIQSKSSMSKRTKSSRMVRVGSASVALLAEKALIAHGVGPGVRTEPRVRGCLQEGAPRSRERGALKALLETSDGPDMDMRVLGRRGARSPTPGRQLRMASCTCPGATCCHLTCKLLPPQGMRSL